ncbi:hypothetical protein HPB51_007804 [Rhipicephalus microplus]|uniref:Uncharacterized protein n=1 Tax=Rhipicephalus microplus TaxID=6941 RepID=A0A9J6EZL6_RHIMP|nr:hypothetical protein HPB51_007804 [Rhipicephalus microplus]
MLHVMPADSLLRSKRWRFSGVLRPCIAATHGECNGLLLSHIRVRRPNRGTVDDLALRVYDGNRKSLAISVLGGIYETCLHLVLVNFLKYRRRSCLATTCVVHRIDIMGLWSNDELLPYFFGWSRTTGETPHHHYHHHHYGLLRNPPTSVAEFITEATTIERALQQRRRYHNQPKNTSPSLSALTASSEYSLRELLREVVREKIRNLLVTPQENTMACVAEVVRQELLQAFSLPESPSDQRSVSYASAVRRHTLVSYNSSLLAYRDVSQGPYNEPWAPAPNPPQPYPQSNVPMQTVPMYTPPTSASWSQGYIYHFPFNLSQRRPQFKLNPLCLRAPLQTIRHDFTQHDCVLFLNLTFDGAPAVRKSVKITEDISFTLFFQDVEVTKLDGIDIPKTVNDIRCLTRLLEAVEGFDETPTLKSEDKTSGILKLVVSLLEDAMNQEMQDEERHDACTFLREQVMLLLSKSPHYSSDLLVFSSLLFTISPHAYRYLRNYGGLKLPHE